MGELESPLFGGHRGTTSTGVSSGGVYVHLHDYEEGALARFGYDFVLPEQWAGLHHGADDESGEYRLIRAVLVRAVDDLLDWCARSKGSTRASQRELADTLRWLCDEAENYVNPFNFNFICRELSLSSSALRRAVVARVVGAIFGNADGIHQCGRTSSGENRLVVETPHSCGRDKHHRGRTRNGQVNPDGADSGSRNAGTRVA